ncbi:hypothetical protein Gura_1742 [Geotalea uraniireducens Rf4]|uniref:Uncharacterized protein n=1 Tax=Geotalea uraniireducens (strain Rf4) TaxID=351605 RepID=A5GET0_GEOUR|nr:hypothetical protein Gura_1742 [Geotalea uraniireducens Rf4]
MKKGAVNRLSTFNPTKGEWHEIKQNLTNSLSDPGGSRICFQRLWRWWRRRCSYGFGCYSVRITTNPMVDAKGTAAAGSPLKLNPDGSFAFNVSGMTPPFILKADGTTGGTSITMFSVAMGTGTANINPMSSIVVAAAAGVNDPALVFADPVTNAPKITNATFNKAVADMQTMMAPILTAFNATGMNPVTLPIIRDLMRSSMWSRCRSTPRRGPCRCSTRRRGRPGSQSVPP